MKILALTRYERNGPSSRLRIFQYIPHLKSTGISVQVESLFNAEYIRRLYSLGKRPKSEILRGYIKRLSKLLKMNQYSLLWIEKELFPWVPIIEDWILAKINLPYVVDYDDAIFHQYDRHRSPIVRAILGKKIDGIMHRASTVIVGNAYLAEHAENAGAKRVRIIPTVVDTQHYGTHQIKDHNYTIGWIGTPITEKYLENVRGPLNALSKESDFIITLIGASKDAFSSLSPNIVEWTEQSEVESIQSFDVGIMPLDDSPFEMGKCGYKIVQYMACGVPVVASPVGVNKEIVSHGENGYLARDEDEWIKYLRILRDDSQLRHIMGMNARAKIEREYSLSRTGPILADILINALDK